MRLKILLLVSCILFLVTGCKSVLVVNDAKAEKVVTILKDYAGIHGYQLSYQNLDTGSFRLELGSVYVANTSQTIATKQKIRDNPQKENVNEPLTSYEQTTLETVNTPGHYVQLAAMIRVVQAEENVSITIEDTGYSSYIGNIANDFCSYLQSFGYTTRYQ